MSDAELRITTYLSDIYTSAERILVMLEKETLESFQSSSSMTIQDAVARRYTIIGEASAALLRKYPEFCQAHPEMETPLQLAKGMRNIIVHEYNRVMWQILWDTAKKDLPKLIDSIAPFLREKS